MLEAKLDINPALEEMERKRRNGKKEKGRERGRRKKKVIGRKKARDTTRVIT